MTKPREIIVVARDFSEAAIAKLKQDLTAQGATVKDSWRNCVKCQYAGNLKLLRELENVEGISPVLTYRNPGSNPGIHR